MRIRQDFLFFVLISFMRDIIRLDACLCSRETQSSVHMRLSGYNKRCTTAKKKKKKMKHAHSMCVEALSWVT